jgi:hypothetical protein
MTMSMRTKLGIVAIIGMVAGIIALRCLQVSVPAAHAAIGDTTALGNGEVKAVEILASATATNSPPSANAGVAVNALSLYGSVPQRGALVIASTAGSGTMTATFRLWGKLPVASGIWVPLGPGTDAAKGVINTGSAIGETGSDTLRHSEMVENLGMFERLYVEITAIGGTATAVTAWMVVQRPAL